MNINIDISETNSKLVKLNKSEPIRRKKKKIVSIKQAISNIKPIKCKNKIEISQDKSELNTEDIETILKSKSMLIVCDYDTKDKYRELIEYFNYLHINTFILCLYNQNIIIHDDLDILKIVDKYSEQDFNSFIKFIVKRFKTLDTIIITFEDVKYILLNSIKKYINDSMCMSFDDILELDDINILASLKLNSKYYYIDNLINCFRNRIIEPFDKIYNMIEIGISVFIPKCDNFCKYLEKIKNVEIFHGDSDDCQVDICFVDQNFLLKNKSKVICFVDTFEDIKNIDQVDILIYNSNLMKEYFETKINKQSYVIRSPVDNTIFYPPTKKYTNKLKIITNHCSDPACYKYYYDLSEYCFTNKEFEFTFIGNDFSDEFSTRNLRIIPVSNKLELASELRKHDIFISASIDNSSLCIQEAITCGLPVLYLDQPNVCQEYCESIRAKIGESFSSFDELTRKLEVIRNNYNDYRDNVIKNIPNQSEYYAKIFKIMLSLFQI